MTVMDYVFTTLQLGMILVSTLFVIVIIALAWPKGQLRSFILKILTAGACTAYIVWPVDGLGDALFVVGDDLFALTIAAFAVFGAFDIAKRALTKTDGEQKVIAAKKPRLLEKTKPTARNKRDIGNAITEPDLKKTKEIQLPA